MADQLQSSDTLAVYLSLFYDDPTAIKRSNKLVVARSQPVLRKLMTTDNWSREAFVDAAKSARAHLRMERETGLIKNVPFRLDPEGKLRGNYCVWLAYRAILETVRDNLMVSHPMMPKMRSRYRYSVDSFIMRSGALRTEADKAKYREDMTVSQEEVSALATAEAAIWELHKKRSDEHNRMVDALKEDPLSPYEKDMSTVEWLHDQTSDEVWLAKRDLIDMVVMGPLVAMKFKKSKSKVVMTRTHFERLMKMLRSTFILAMSLHELRLKVAPFELILDLVDYWWDVVEEDTDFLGEVLKASRQILINKLDESYLSGDTPLTGYLSSLNPRRRALARVMASKIQGVSRSLEDAINLTNIFKLVPHPDTNMYELFTTMEGVRDPNPVDPDMLTRFEGTLRRSIFASLTALGTDPRVVAREESGQIIADKVAATRRQDAVLKQMSANTWAKTNFTKLENFIGIMDIQVLASSKASQISAPFTEDDLVNSAQYAAGILDEPPPFLLEARTVNDAASELFGESQLKPDQAIKRFQKIIDLHESFEAKYPGMAIDEIPSSDLEKFLLEHDSARYLVGTEPKFGEVHKKVTRMFYMAEQSLKTITQRVERYVKQITRKQSGVSITKSYPARRRDLESFCRNMTADHFGPRSVFVSFDMSEFSKKFPMELVRRYGEILAELTGEEWLRRIDLVFRASVVIHNSRGFFSYLAGVRGGFEGFFNFVWSSIHAVIMEIALESTGLAGEILVFSDDGCLLFYAPKEMTDSVVWGKIQGIQKMYAKLGLHFHLGKSLVSTHVWEYLGDVCYNNKLIPMWIKEVISITRSAKNRGLEPFYSKIKSLQAQCDAVVTAGGPPDVAYIIKRFLFGCHLDRIKIPYLPRLEEALSIIPPSCGGLRILSPFESCALTTIEKDSEVITDLVLLAKHDIELSRIITSKIAQRSRPRADITSAVIAGSRMNTDHPDVSGFSVLNEAIDLMAARASKPVAKSPLTFEFNKNLKDVMYSMEDINLSMLSDFILSTPAWVEYTKSLSVVRSAGVLRLVPRREIMKLQSADTKRVALAINQWRDDIHKGLQGTKIYDPFSMITQCTKSVYRGISIAKLRPSPRIALGTTIRASGIIVKMNLHKAPTLSSQEYMEPKINLSQDMTTISWFSESTGDTQIKSIRRFLDNAARFLTHSPESEPCLQVLSSMLGIHLPSLPPLIVRGGHRLGRTKGRDVDCKLILPRWFLVGTEANYFGPMAEDLYKKGRSDRTTYLQCAKVLSYFLGTTQFEARHEIEEKVIIHKWYIDDSLYDSMHMYKPMKLSQKNFPLFPVDPISERLETEFIASYSEYVKTSERLEIISSTNYVYEPLDPTERIMIRTVYTQSLKRWLVQAYFHARDTLLPSAEITLPRMELVSLFKKAYVEASLTVMEPTERRKLLDLMWKYIFDLRNKGVSDLESVTSAQVYENFLGVLESVVSITAGFLPAHASEDEIYSEVTEPNGVITSLQEYVERNSLTVEKPGLVVVRGNAYEKGNVTPAHRSALREAFTATLSQVLTLAYNLDWDEKKIGSELKLPMNLDDLISCLYLCRDLLRESHHRSLSHPYNRKSSVIELYKAFYVLDQLDRRIDRIRDEDDPESWMEEFISTEVMPSLVRSEFVMKFKLTKNKRDHLKMLESPVLPTFRNRMMQMARALLGGRYYGVAARRGRWYSYSILEVENVVSTFYGAIIEKAVRSIYEYSTELESFILSEFKPDSATSFELVDIASSTYGISSTKLEEEDLPPRHRTVLRKVTRRIVEEFMRKNLIGGLEPIERDNPLLNQAIGDYAVDSGLRVCSWSGATPDDAQAYLYLLTSTDPSRIISDYISILKDPGSVAVTVRDTYSGGILLVGMSHRSLDVTEATPAISGVDNPSVLIPSIKMADLTEIEMERVVRELISPGELRMDKNRFAAAYSKLVSGFRQVNNQSLLLQATLEEVRDNYSPSMAINAYASLLLLVTGNENVTLIGSVGKRIVDTLTTADRHTRTRLSMDIGMVVTWFNTVAIAQGEHLLSDAILNLRSQIRKYQYKVNIPVGIVALKPAPIEDILGSKMGSRLSDLVGNVSHLLFIEEPILRVGGSEDRLLTYEVSREEEAKADAQVDELW